MRVMWFELVAIVGVVVFVIYTTLEAIGVITVSMPSIISMGTAFAAGYMFGQHNKRRRKKRATKHLNSGGKPAKQN